MKPTLTDRERAEIRKRLYDQKKRNWTFIVEALSEASQTNAGQIMGCMENDGYGLLHYFNKAIKDYIDSELMEDAENEVLASKEVNGKRWMEA